MAHLEQVGFWQAVFEAARSSVERPGGWPRQRPDAPQQPPECGMLNHLLNHLLNRVLNQASSAGEPCVYALPAARL